jgi:DNA-binding transcriptional MerR regulator
MVQDDGKAAGAMLAIGELADRIGVPTHVLRYWETRFPELKPLQRSGRRRYYRAADVALAGKIHELLHVKGYTVEGARKALSDDGAIAAVAAPASPHGGGKSGVSVEDLIALRQRLATAIGVLI